ncbi:MAG TPA: CDP-archaeol synthase, partial [Acidimicrobiales bacterium]|nr:CDP-archaeol synthase [Acidimicrobiales bacterium]
DHSQGRLRSAARSRSNVRVVAAGTDAPNGDDLGTDDVSSVGPALRGQERRPYDVTAERGMSRPGRDVSAAVTTGLAMAVVFVFAYLIGTGALLALASVALVGCAVEAFSMLQRAGFRPATLVGALGTLGAVLAAYWKGPGALGLVMALVVGASLLWYLAKVVEARPVVNAAVTTLAFTWVGIMGSFAGVLLAMPSGSRLFVGAVVPTVIADMAAWFAGSRFGSHQMAPTVSPGKTWEGFFAGAVAAVVVGAVIGGALAPWTLTRGIVLGLMIAVVAPVGDLVQSMVKRDLRLKDSGALLPGHGGLLDRFDSVLFALPATYCLVTVLHIA